MLLLCAEIVWLHGRKIPSNMETGKLIIKKDVTKTYVNTVQYVAGR